MPHQTETMTINMGPQHPSTHGVLRIILELNGETIVKATPEIGYLHTGMEKLAEYRLYAHWLTVTDRMDYLAPMSNNLGYCLAVEKLLGIEAPPRAQVVRVIMTELTRLASHLLWLGTHAMDIGAMSMLLYCFRERELVLGIYELVSGQRMMSSYFRIGGLMKDIPPDFESRVKEIFQIMPSRIGEYEDLLTNNRIWIQRTKGVGVISAQDAIDWGVTGPSLRGSGVNWDLRKAMPYTGYEKYSFYVPLGKNGDVYDRYLIRVQEMKESLKIVEQALGDIPPGDYIARIPGVTLPPKEDVLTNMEALIYQFKLVVHGMRPPEGEVYQAIESPRGEQGFYICSDGTGKPYRIHVRAPSFVNLSALPKMVEGGLVADVVAAIGSIDIVLGEIDR